MREQPGNDARNSCANRVGSKRGADFCCCRYVRRRQRARSENHARFCASSCVKPPAIYDRRRQTNAPFRPARRRLNRLVEDDGKEAADAFACHPRERGRALVVQREAHGGHIVLIKLDARASQIFSRYHRDTAQEIVNGAGSRSGRRRIAAAAQQLHVGRDHPARAAKQIFRPDAGRARRASMRDAGRPMISLRTVNR